MAVYVKPQAEEVVITTLVGALVAVAVTSLLTAGAAGYLPSTAHGIVSTIRMTLFWISLIGGGAIGAWYGVRQERDTHLSGARYYPEPAAAHRALQAVQTAAMSPAQQAHRVPGIVIGGIEMARATMARHILATGPNGSGKTTVIRAIIDQALARGDRVVIHDYSGDFGNMYFDADDSVLLGPWNPRASVWNAAGDIADPSLADEFASMIFDTKNAGLKDPHWYIAAAHVLGGVIKAHMRTGEPWTWASLQHELAGDPIALVQTAARGDATVRQHFATCFPPPGSDKGPVIIPEQASILSTMADKIGWIGNYAAVEASKSAGERFSFVGWMHGTAHRSVRKVFLNYSARNSGAAEQIFGGMIATLAAIIQDPTSPDRGPDESAAVWVILDEFAQLGPAALKATQSISELGRKKGARVVIALQTPSQIVARLGEDKAKPVLQQQVTRIYAAQAPEAAERAVALAGEHEIERIQTTSENGAVSGKIKTVLKEKVLSAGDLTGLRVIRNVGVEVIMQSGDVLGKVVQRFGPRLPDTGVSKLVSDTWARGALPHDEPPATPSAPAPSAAPVQPSQPAKDAANEEVGWAGDYALDDPEDGDEDEGDDSEDSEP